MSSSSSLLWPDGTLLDPLPYLQGLYQLIPPQRLAFILKRTARQSRRRRRLPADAVAFGSFNLDFEGEQWQTLDELLARVGVPGALDEMRSSFLEDSDGALTEEQLDALLGGEVGY